MSWHLTPAQVDEYVSSTVDDVTAMSVEAHLMHCPPCRSLVPADEAWLADSWADLRDIVDRPRVGLLERALTALGLRQTTARLLTATPQLYRAWLVATVVVLAAALLSAHHLPRGSLLFAFTAPVVPLVGVAVAYGRGVDPAHTLTSVTPLAGQRLLFLRSCAVLVPALVMCTAAALLMPSPTTLWNAGFWLLPSLTLVAGSLVLSRWMHLSAAGAAVGGLWVLAMVLFAATDQISVLELFAPVSQLWWAAALAALVGAIVLRVRPA
ncbi:zf-HC2 domain-containing protein [Nocardiopsis sp. NRRL B-16309]|uniref:zf-HC2 domain-containing protein n=1 Tax=Nocardiopsis sp. NRRL B-16309 TaxID=1519494 RepID=UPI0006AF14AC|nr:zf-HC2 domain-containing protein [Nocardiopsis sp. NRRL B-16309]KOX10100.1 membrane protein [Nocardiopsis sp. NRRL B-16309]